MKKNRDTAEDNALHQLLTKCDSLQVKPVNLSLFIYNCPSTQSRIVFHNLMKNYAIINKKALDINGLSSQYF